MECSPLEVVEEKVDFLLQNMEDMFAGLQLEYFQEHQVCDLMHIVGNFLTRLDRFMKHGYCVNGTDTYSLVRPYFIHMVLPELLSH